MNMDFRDQFQKVSDDVGKMAKKVADNSKKAAVRSRIRRLMNQSDAALQSIYCEIGSKYYTEHQNEPEESYVSLFAQASDILAQIESLKAELVGLDHGTICPSCGSIVDDLQKFCPSCGSKNTSYGKWKAEEEAAEAARNAAREAEQAEREARKAEKAAQTEVYETTAAAVLDEEDAPDIEIPPTDGTSCIEE